jgi:flagellin FlaB
MSYKNDSAFTGLEAAIVLIAFVVVAAVFSYVVLGAGFFTTQKSQETVYKGVEQATSNIQMMGQVYGMGAQTTGNGTAAGIEKIKFTIGLAPGAPSVDLSKLTIVYSNETVSPRLVQQISGTSGAVYGFAATKQGSAVTTMAGQEQIDLEFMTGYTATEQPGKNTKITIEIRPAVGASLPFTRTVPATIQTVNVLY